MSESESSIIVAVLADARQAQRAYERLRALVTVRVAGLTPESARKAVALLEHYGAYDAHSGRARRSEFAPHIRTEEPSPCFDLTHSADRQHFHGGAADADSDTPRR